jgi:NNP family nitrate/nitrite transporter-like MFS transporter
MDHLSILGIQIKIELGLNDTQFSILVATPILTGSLSHLFLDVWADQYGRRLIFTLQMLATAIPTFFLTMVSSYPIFVNNVEITNDDVHVEMQYHPAESVDKSRH